jgi:NitT/TauT family transport system substrate-binding protein
LNRPRLSLIALFLVAGLACTPAAAPSPTAAPAKPAAPAAPAAKPAESPAAAPAAKPAASPAAAPAAAPAASPATAPAAKPAASPAAAPAAQPAASPAAAAAAKPQDIRVPKPSGDLNIKVGHPSSVSFYDVPTQLTHERLKADGWSIETVEFTRTDLNTQALSQGTVQLAISQHLDPLRVAEKGGRVSWLMENNGGEFLMIGKREIADCKGLDGKRFGIHGETSTTSLATVNWLKDDCKVNANILVIPGGENRIVALMNDQIDGTLVQLGDWLNLDAKAPGRFHVVPTGPLYDISGASLWANSEWVEKNPEVATAYVAETLKTFRLIHADPTVLTSKIPTYLPETPKEAIEPTVKGYLEVVKAWPQNGGDATAIRDAAKFFEGQKELQPGMDMAKVINTTPLENALKIVGRVPTSR